MATERASRHESYYREVGRSYDMRAPALAREWESPSMKLYRSAALQIYHSFLARPSPGQKEVRMLEYGAGIGRIAGHLFREEPFLAGSLLPVTLTAVDVSGQSLAIYAKNVAAPRLQITPVVGNIVTFLEGMPETNLFDAVFSNGAYQIPPDDLSYIIGESIHHLKEGGTMIFDFLPSEGKRQHTVYSEKSPRGNYDTFHYPVEEISRFIHQSIRDESGEGGYTYRFLKLSELKNGQTGHFYGPLTVPDIEKGSGEKKIDPVFCIVRRSSVAREKQEEVERLYTDALEKVGGYFGKKLPALPLKFDIQPQGYVHLREEKKKYISVNPAGNTSALAKQLEIAITAYAAEAVTGKKLPAALAGFGLAAADDPFARLKRYMDGGTEGIKQAVRLLDVYRIVTAPASVDGVDASILGNALLEYIRRSKGEQVLREFFLAGVCDEDFLYNNKAENFFAAAVRHYGSVAEFQKGFLRMVLGEEGVAVYEDIRHPVRSTIKKIIGFAKTFLRRLLG